MKNRKILVTGASGFIGSALCPYLVANNYSVRAASSQKVAVNGVEWVPVNYQDGANDWKNSLQGMDTVIHLAGLAHFHWKTKKNPFSQFSGGIDVIKQLEQANVVNTRTLAKIAKSTGLRRLIFISSIGAVTSSSKAMITEGTIPNPDTEYGRSKLMAELVLREELQGSKTELVIIRPPLVYGPNNVANMSRLIRWVESGIPIPLSLVQNRRSLIGIDNLVSLIASCIEADGAVGKALLVSDGQDMSTAELVRRIAVIRKKPCRLFPAPFFTLRMIDRLLRVEVFGKLCGDLFVDIASTCSRLGWQPTVDVDEGLRRTMEGGSSSGNRIYKL